MSVSGIVPTLVCLAMLLVKKQEFDFEIGRKLILLSVLFYLLPFQAVKYLFPTSFVKYIDISLHLDYYDGFEKSIVLSLGKNDYWIPDMVAILGILWMVTIIIFTAIQFILYERRISAIKKCSKETSIYVDGMGERVVRVMERLDGPYTVGFIKPFIVFPKTLLKEKEFSMVYCHEYYHLKKRDSLVKLLCLITFCVHWYNPLALINLVLYEQFSEFLADKRVVNSCTDIQKKEYIKFMIQLASAKDNMPMVWKNNFLTTKKMIEWRMIIIMKKKTKRKLVSSVLAVMISIICSTTTILAYDPMWTSSGTKNILGADEEFMQFYNNESIETNSWIGDVFISEDGEESPILESSDSEERALCIHDFEWGQLGHHIPNSSGGCTMYFYEAKRCVKCDYLVVYDLIYTINYVTCPH